MEVIAREGLRVPMETGKRRYVTDAETVDVPNTVYYRRRIAEGDLLTGEDATKAAAAAKAKAAANAPETVAEPDAAVVSTGDKKAAKGA